MKVKDSMHHDPFSAVTGPKVTGIESFACSKDIVIPIKEFMIADNNTYDCHEEQIGIIFEIQINKSFSVQKLGYLPEKFGCIVDSPTIGPVCKKIRRFKIFYFFKELKTNFD